MKAYKGFNKDMTCRGFQFKEGETYHEEEAVLCESGFHACEDPLDCFEYYNPSTSEYHEVEIDGVADERHEDDSKACAKTIKIGAKLDIAGICKAHFEYVKSKINESKNQNVQGNRSAASVQGNRSAASVQGYWSAASVQGDWSAASVQGYGSVSVATGNESNAIADNGSISIGWGKDNICKGDIGSYIVLVERGDWDGEKYPQIGEPKLGKIDGEKLKADTWYKLESGEFVEVEANE